MSKLELTRYLYFKDEVILSFVISLLKKQNLHECYFWFSELYYSKYNINNIILKIYYDFYYINNRQFEKYIYKKLISNHNENDILSKYITIIKNLFRLSISCDVFLNRQKYLKFITNDCVDNPDIKNKNSTRGRKPKWLENIKEEFHTLFRYLNKNKLGDFYCELHNIDEDSLKDIFNQLKLYDKNINFNLLNNDWYKYDIRHIVLAYIIRYNIDSEDINDSNSENSKDKEKKIYVLASKYEIEQIKNTDVPIPSRNFVDNRNNVHEINEVRKTLHCKRHFTIDSDIYHI